jgi:hypothetical protein
MTRFLLAAALLAPLTLLPHPADAQRRTAVVRVTDVQGRPIPFALVQIENGVTRVADDSGRVTLPAERNDSLRLQVRRMGFNPFVGWTTPDSATGEHIADLIPLPRALDAVSVEGRRDTPLARTGFYDRMVRVQRGAYSARFITPEELDMRNPARLSHMLSGDRLLKVQYTNNQKIILLSRSPNCAMTILLDGMKATGTLEEAVGPAGVMSSFQGLMSVDELVPVTSIAAIEIYGSMAAAPVELQRAAGTSAGCGVVAIWTGSRR